MKKRIVISLALLLGILVMAVLVAPVSAGLTITNSGAKIVSPYGETSLIITITDSAIPAVGTITVNITDLHPYVAAPPFTTGNVLVEGDSASNWTYDVTDNTLTLTLNGGAAASVDESITLIFTGSEGNPWVADSGGEQVVILNAVRSDEPAVEVPFNFIIDTGGLTITDGDKIISPFGAMSPLITVSESAIPGGSTITIDAINLYLWVNSGTFTDTNVVVTSDAAAATWTGTVSGDGGVDQIITLTSTGGATVVGENITVTFTGAGKNPWLPGSTDIYGDVTAPLTVTRTDTGQTAVINFMIETPTVPPGGLTVTDGEKIISQDGATSPVITVADSDIPADGTIIINVPDLYLFVNSGTFTDANVVVTSDAAAATWTGAVSGDGGVDQIITLTSNAAPTVVGENITVTFTGAGGNPWVSDSFTAYGDVSMPLTVTRTDTFQKADPPLNFMINTSTPAGPFPLANFHTSTKADIAPLAVAFTDTSLRNPSSWSWDFGDGETSADRNPVHTYTEAGTFTVSLTASNAYGSDTKTRGDYVNVLNGRTLVANTSIAGLTVNTCGSHQTVTVDTSVLSAALIPNNSVLEIQPSPDRGFKNITLYALNGAGFSRHANLITGNLTGVHLVSEEIAPAPGFSRDTGPNATFNYSVDLSSWPCNALLSTKIWEGVIPATDNKFRQIVDGNQGSVVGTAYTAKITKTNFPPGTPVKIQMSVNSSWNTYPHLPGAPGKMFIWRIADDENSGQILHTQYQHSDPINHLDYYEANSALGMSTFGLSSLTGNNNPFQLITFTIAQAINPPNAETITPTATPTVSPTTKVQNATPLKPVTPADPGKTEKIFANANGVITQATILKSTDALATVSLGLGVVAKDREGKPLSSISITTIPEQDLPAVPSGTSFTFAGVAYNLDPDGATFSPSIPVTFTVPKAQSGHDLIVRAYDHTTDTWQEMPSRYDPVAGIITAEVPHFCCFALFAKSPVPSTPDAITTSVPTASPKAPSSPPPTPVSNFIGMILWIVNLLVKNILVIVGIVILAIAIFLYGRKRRRDKVMHLL